MSLLWPVCVFTFSPFQSGTSFLVLVLLLDRTWGWFVLLWRILSNCHFLGVYQCECMLGSEFAEECEIWRLTFPCWCLPSRGRIAYGLSSWTLELSTWPQHPLLLPPGFVTSHSALSHLSCFSCKGGCWQEHLPVQWGTERVHGCTVLRMAPGPCRLPACESYSHVESVLCAWHYAVLPLLYHI